MRGVRPVMGRTTIGSTRRVMQQRLIWLVRGPLVPSLRLESRCTQALGKGDLLGAVEHLTSKPYRKLRDIPDR